MVLTLTSDIIMQSEPEKQKEFQISDKKSYNLSEFKIIFETRQVLIQKFYNASDYEIKLLKRVRFGHWK